MKKLVNLPMAMASLMPVGATARAQTPPAQSTEGPAVLEEVLVTAANRTGSEAMRESSAAASVSRT